ncbi:MAG: metal ABC transporter permease [Varibaculum cambriense]|uniref:metal ABC transporter permease n=1 Tax=Varibaculum cambriense TaxID=184870 RepID=UPI001EB4B9A5|nr:metal ABC transporter permease [Varibaculum cambriense]MBS5919622.1 metal ABC transporter permease [Varibaculum cambriense]
MKLALTNLSILFPQGLIPLSDFWGTYSFRVMTAGAILVGFFAGTLGSLLYVRKQSLVSDVIGHSSIAGIVGAFVIASLMGADGQSILVLTIGATISGLLAVATTNLIAEKSKVGVEAAMAISLAIYYGGGMVALRLLSFSHFSGRSGIAQYLFGNAATMRQIDVLIVAILGFTALLIVVIFWKEIALFAFDPVGAQAAGFSGNLLIAIVTLCTTVGIVIGVKSVGVVLMVAFAIIPAAAARQWTDHLPVLFLLAGAIGALSGGFGSYLAVSIGKVPTGPVIVVILSLVLAISLVFSPHRSLLAYRYRRRRHIQNLKHEQEDNASLAQGNSWKEQSTNPAAIANHLCFSPTKVEEGGTPYAVVQSAGTLSHKSQLDPEVNLK